MLVHRRLLMKTVSNRDMIFHPHIHRLQLGYHSVIPPKVSPRTSTCHPPQKGPFQKERQTSSNQHFEEQAVSFRFLKFRHPRLCISNLGAPNTNPFFLVVEQKPTRFRRDPVYPLPKKDLQKEGFFQHPQNWEWVPWGTVGQNLQAFCGDSEVYLGLSPFPGCNRHHQDDTI